MTLKQINWLFSLLIDLAFIPKIKYKGKVNTKVKLLNVLFYFKNNPESLKTQIVPSLFIIKVLTSKKFEQVFYYYIHIFPPEA